MANRWWGRATVTGSQLIPKAVFMNRVIALAMALVYFHTQVLCAGTAAFPLPLNKTSFTVHLQKLIPTWLSRPWSSSSSLKGEGRVKSGDGSISLPSPLEGEGGRRPGEGTLKGVFAQAFKQGLLRHRRVLSFLPGVPGMHRQQPYVFHAWPDVSSDPNNSYSRDRERQSGYSSLERVREGERLSTSALGLRQELDQLRRQQYRPQGLATSVAPTINTGRASQRPTAANPATALDRALAEQQAQRVVTDVELQADIEEATRGTRGIASRRRVREDGTVENYDTYNRLTSIENEKVTDPNTGVTLSRKTTFGYGGSGSQPTRITYVDTAPDGTVQSTAERDQIQFDDQRRVVFYRETTRNAEGEVTEVRERRNIQYRDPQEGGQQNVTDYQEVVTDRVGSTLTTEWSRGTYYVNPQWTGSSDRTHPRFFLGGYTSMTTGPDGVTYTAQWSRMTYDPTGRLASYLQVSRSSLGDHLVTTEGSSYSYGSDGRIASFTQRLSDEHGNISTIAQSGSIYDPQGRILEYTRTISDHRGTTWQETTSLIQYDFKGRQISYQRTLTDPQGTLTTIQWQAGAPGFASTHNRLGLLLAFTETITSGSLRIERSTVGIVYDERTGTVLHSRVTVRTSGTTNIRTASHTEDRTVSGQVSSTEDRVHDQGFDERGTLVRDVWTNTIRTDITATGFTETRVLLDVTTVTRRSGIELDGAGRTVRYQDLETTSAAPGVSLQRIAFGVVYDPLGHVVESQEQLTTAAGLNILTSRSGIRYNGLNQTIGLHTVIHTTGAGMDRTEDTLRSEISYTPFGDEVAGYRERTTSTDAPGLVTERTWRAAEFNRNGQFTRTLQETHLTGSDPVHGSFNITRQTETRDIRYDRSGRIIGNTERSTSSEASDLVILTAISGVTYDAEGHQATFVQSTTRRDRTGQRLEVTSTVTRSAPQFTQATPMRDGGILTGYTERTELTGRDGTQTLNHVTTAIRRDIVWHPTGNPISYIERITSSDAPELVSLVTRRDTLDAQGRVTQFNLTTVLETWDGRRLNTTLLERTQNTYDALGRIIAYRERTVTSERPWAPTTHEWQGTYTIQNQLQSSQELFVTRGRDRMSGDAIDLRQETTQHDRVYNSLGQLVSFVQHSRQSGTASERLGLPSSWMQMAHQERLAWLNGVVFRIGNSDIAFRSLSPAQRTELLAGGETSVGGRLLALGGASVVWELQTESTIRRSQTTHNRLDQLTRFAEEGNDQSGAYTRQWQAIGPTPYDLQNRLVSFRERTDRPGELTITTERQHTEYAGRGLPSLTRERTTTSADRGATLTTTFDMAYDSLGRLIGQTRIERRHGVSENGSVLDQTTTTIQDRTHYNLLGQVSGYRQISHDGSSQVVTIAQFFGVSYDPAGRQYRFLLETVRSGQLPRGEQALDGTSRTLREESRTIRSHTGYTPTGRAATTQETVRTSREEMISTIDTSIAYNQRGQAVRTETRTRRQGPGVEHVVETSRSGVEYNDLGLPTRWVDRAPGPNGRDVTTATEQVTYDQQGRVSHRRIISSEGGQPSDYTQRLSYDSLSRLTQTMTDGRVNGILYVQLKELFGYDLVGRPLLTFTEGYTGGQLNRYTRWNTYDPQGRLEMTETNGIVSTQVYERLRNFFEYDTKERAVMTRVEGRIAGLLNRYTQQNIYIGDTLNQTIIRGTVNGISNVLRTTSGMAYDQGGRLESQRVEEFRGRTLFERYLQTFTYRDGLVIRMAMEGTVAGVANVSRTQETLQYDAQGNPAEVHTRETRGGALYEDIVTRSTYDPTSGQVIQSTESGLRGESQLQLTHTFRYNQTLGQVTQLHTQGTMITHGIMILIDFQDTFSYYQDGPHAGRIHLVERRGQDETGRLLGGRRTLTTYDSLGRTATILVQGTTVGLDDRTTTLNRVDTFFYDPETYQPARVRTVTDSFVHEILERTHQDVTVVNEYDRDGVLVGGFGQGISTTSDRYGIVTHGTLTQRYLAIQGQLRLTSASTDSSTQQGATTTRQFVTVNYTYDEQTGQLRSAQGSGSGTTVTRHADGTSSVTEFTLDQAYVIQAGQALLSQSIQRSLTRQGSSVTTQTSLTNNTYDSLGRLIQTTGEARGTTTVTNGDGTRTVTEFTSQSEYMVRWGQALVTRTTSHSTSRTQGDSTITVQDGETRFTYDDSGRLTGATGNARGTTTVINADGTRTVTEFTSQSEYMVRWGQALVTRTESQSTTTNPDGSTSSSTITVTYTYNDLGQLTGARGSGTSTSRDALGNVTTSEITQTYIIQWGMALVSEVTTRSTTTRGTGSTTTSSTTVRYFYDAEGRLIGGEGTGEGTTTTANLDGSVTTTRFTTHQRYGAIHGQAVLLDATTSSTTTSTLDASTRTEAVTVTYTYNELGQLIGASGTGTITGADRDGNPITGTIQQTYVVIGGQALISESVVDTTTTLHGGGTVTEHFRIRNDYDLATGRLLKTSTEGVTHDSVQGLITRHNFTDTYEYNPDGSYRVTREGTTEIGSMTTPSYGGGSRSHRPPRYQDDDRHHLMMDDGFRDDWSDDRGFSDSREPVFTPKVTKHWHVVTEYAADGRILSVTDRSTTQHHDAGVTEVSDVHDVYTYHDNRTLASIERTGTTTLSGSGGTVVREWHQTTTFEQINGRTLASTIEDRSIIHNADGTADHLNSVTRNTYDTEGNLTGSRTDGETLRYDTRSGQVIGRAESHRVVAYERGRITSDVEHGRQMGNIRDGEGNLVGGARYVTQRTYGYDTDTSRQASRETTDTWVEGSGGTHEERTNIRYNREGLVIGYDYARYHTNAVGAEGNQITYAGSGERQAISGGVHGTVHEIRYDSLNRPIYQREFRNFAEEAGIPGADLKHGSAWITTETHYDVQGRVVWQSTTASGSARETPWNGIRGYNGSFSITYIQSGMTYDQLGRLTGYQYASTGPTVVQDKKNPFIAYLTTTGHVTMTLDQLGRVTQTITTYRWDLDKKHYSNGTITTVIQGFNEFGRPTSSITYNNTFTRTPNAKVTDTRVYHNTYVYDDQGRLLRTDNQQIAGRMDAKRTGFWSSWVGRIIAIAVVVVVSILTFGIGSYAGVAVLAHLAIGLKLAIVFVTSMLMTRLQTGSWKAGLVAGIVAAATVGILQIPVVKNFVDKIFTAVGDFFKDFFQKIKAAFGGATAAISTGITDGALAGGAAGAAGGTSGLLPSARYITSFSTFLKLWGIQTLREFTMSESIQLLSRNSALRPFAFTLASVGMFALEWATGLNLSGRADVAGQNPSLFRPRLRFAGNALQEAVTLKQALFNMKGLGRLAFERAFSDLLQFPLTKFLGRENAFAPLLTMWTGRLGSAMAHGASSSLFGWQYHVAFDRGHYQLIKERAGMQIVTTYAADQNGRPTSRILDQSRFFQPAFLTKRDLHALRNDKDFKQRFPDLNLSDADFRRLVKGVSFSRTDLKTTVFLSVTERSLDRLSERLGESTELVNELRSFLATHEAGLDAGGFTRDRTLTIARDAVTRYDGSQELVTSGLSLSGRDRSGAIFSITLDPRHPTPKPVYQLLFDPTKTFDDRAKAQLIATFREFLTDRQMALFEQNVKQNLDTLNTLLRSRGEENLWQPRGFSFSTDMERTTIVLTNLATHETVSAQFGMDTERLAHEVLPASTLIHLKTLATQAAKSSVATDPKVIESLKAGILANLLSGALAAVKLTLAPDKLASYQALLLLSSESAQALLSFLSPARQRQFQVNTTIMSREAHQPAGGHLMNVTVLLSPHKDEITGITQTFQDRSLRIVSITYTLPTTTVSQLGGITYRSTHGEALRDLRVLTPEELRQAQAMAQKKFNAATFGRYILEGVSVTLANDGKRVSLELRDPTGYRGSVTYTPSFREMFQKLTTVTPESLTVASPHLEFLDTLTAGQASASLKELIKGAYQQILSGQLDLAAFQNIMSHIQSFSLSYGTADQPPSFALTAMVSGLPNGPPAAVTMAYTPLKDINPITYQPRDLPNGTMSYRSTHWEALRDLGVLSESDLTRIEQLAEAKWGDKALTRFTKEGFSVSIGEEGTRISVDLRDHNGNRGFLVFSPETPRAHESLLVSSSSLQFLDNLTGGQATLSLKAFIREAADQARDGRLNPTAFQALLQQVQSFSLSYGGTEAVPTFLVTAMLAGLPNGPPAAVTVSYSHRQGQGSQFDFATLRADALERLGLVSRQTNLACCRQCLLEGLPSFSSG
ncbi:MAG: hypothetical protein HYZ73_05560 [Elusimicrobia bacterium]|nr:hypothetical protein [Elusimicrobiota bacterium]